MPCLTEPEALASAAENFQREFRAHLDTATFGFAPSDGHPQCFRPDVLIVHFGGRRSF